MLMSGLRLSQRWLCRFWSSGMSRVSTGKYIDRVSKGSKFFHFEDQEVQGQSSWTS
jgi:hypothetical protein